MDNDIKSFLGRASSSHTLVIGDVMLDEFHWCDVTRISPEAPVPVCQVSKTTYRPGGAANVAHNILALGGSVTLCGYIGNDGTANNLKNTLQASGIQTDLLVCHDNRPTNLKSRVIAKTQQVLRLDREDISEFDTDLEQALCQGIESAMHNIDVVVLSDYGKGVLSKHVIKFSCDLAALKGIPVIVDPKGKDFSKYHGVTTITPNFSEFQTAVNQPLESEDDIMRTGLQMCRDLDLLFLMITRSEDGMTFITKDGEKKDIPTRAKDVRDITGAGDTVVGDFAICLALHMSLSSAAQIANHAAGISVSKVGTAVVSPDELHAVLTDS